MEKDSDGNAVPDEIMDGGNHSDDFARRRVPENNVPRERRLQTVRGKLTAS